MGIEGRVVLVTGGGGGIGRATALKFAAKGARVVVTDHHESDASETVALISDAGGVAKDLKFDASESTEIETMVHAAEQEFGALHIAVNNVYVEPDYCPIHEIDETGWHRIVDRTLKYTWLAMKYEIQAIKRAGGGVIVNVASTSGINSAPWLSIFGAAKAGVISLTKSAAAELAPDDIRVNCVTPGGVLSDSLAALWTSEPELKSSLKVANAIGRLARPEEIANCIYFICSDEASFMTGDNMVVDGGSGVMPPA